MKTFAEFLGEEVSQKDLNTVTYAPGQDSLINKNVRKRRQDSVAGEAADPCWKGYQQIGMKKKNGKSVPNCVPTKESKESKFRVHATSHEGQKFKSKVFDTKKAADDYHWKLAKGKKFKTLEVRPVNEATELDELSKKTMQSYYAKAQGQLSDITKKKREHSQARTDAIRKGKDPSKIRKPEPTAADHNTFRKRDAGTKVALKKLTKEETQLDEILSIQGRLKRARDIKKNKAKLAMGKHRQSMRIASKERLQDRAKRHARAALVARITKGIPKGELSMQRRAEIERRLERMKNVQTVIARKLLPQVRKDELMKKRSDKSTGNK